MIHRIACWAGIAARAAGALAAYEALWLAAIGLGLLAVICATSCCGSRRSEGDGVPPRARILDVPLDRVW